MAKKTTAVNKESIRKPYRSESATYEEWKVEVPDDDYYGLPHSEFKRPWLNPENSYDTMEYLFDFPLPYIDPYDGHITPPDAGVYPYPGGIPWNPDWYQDGYNPQYPMPDPQWNTDITQAPGGGKGMKITWDCDNTGGFDFCPGDVVTITFEEAYNNPIVSVSSDSGGSIAVIRGHSSPGAAMVSVEVLLKVPLTYEGTWITVTAITRRGLNCTATGAKRSYCGASPCTGVGINYDLPRMNVSTSQVISINNPTPGVNYEFVISHGAGTLSDLGGGSSRFYAPSDNPNCTKNATIELRVKGTDTVCAAVEIAISGWTGEGDGHAYVIKRGGTCVFGIGNWPFCLGRQTWYSCFDAIVLDFNPTGMGECGCTVLTWGLPCAPVDADIAQDLRTEAMLLGGCCPAALA